MKSFTISLLCLLSAFTMSAQAPKNAFELTVKINGYPSGAKLSLGRYYADKQYMNDSSVYDSKRGVYVFSSPERKEGGMYMLISHENVPLELIIDRDQHFSVETDYPNFGERAIFKGSPENEIYTQFNDHVRTYYIRLDSLQKLYPTLDANSEESKVLVQQIQTLLLQVDSLKNQFIDLNPKHLMAAVFKSQKEIPIPEAPASIVDDNKRREWRYYYYKDHYFDYIDLTDARLLYTPIFHQKIEHFVEKVLSPHPDSVKLEIEKVTEKTRPNKILFQYMIWWSVDKYSRSQIVGYDAIWIYLAKKYYLGGDAFWASQSTIDNLRKRIEDGEPLLIGNKPPEFMCPDTNAGRPNEGWISVFAPKTRYTIVIFHSPNCGHCKKQMPVLRDFLKEKGKILDVSVYAVCREVDVDAWRKYIHENGYEAFINVHGQSSTVQYVDLWDAHQSPTIYVLDHERRIVTKKIDVEKIEPFIHNWNELYYPSK